jgi:hypothetical protein
MGQKFYESTLPRIAHALERLADGVDRSMLARSPVAEANPEPPPQAHRCEARSGGHRCTLFKRHDGMHASVTTHDDKAERRKWVSLDRTWLD